MASNLPEFASTTISTDSALAAATVGLVSKEEFTRRREAIEKTELERQLSLEKKDEKKKKKKKARMGSALSFADEDEEGAEQETVKMPKLGKNPNVDTNFLPDKDREEASRLKREELAREWEQEQDAIKAEIIEVTYSYWDGKGHRYAIQVKKGDRIEDFLNQCRQQVRELRSSSPDQLIYVKEDLIMPHNVTFYELIVKKARGKSGPLFNFDVHDDVRMVNDARVEKDESHAGKVMEKRLYERNREKFPYSRFEVYDANKSYDTYTVHGSETFGAGVNTALI
mmetsp:Transcript_30688/g.69212  ORF Transcript_30688/g.69212 Transcript_30688/m.69212 type:complete len:283 (-) Transcript_30688:298-1146(-)